MSRSSIILKNINRENSKLTSQINIKSFDSNSTIRSESIKLSCKSVIFDSGKSSEIKTKSELRIAASIFKKNSSVRLSIVNNTDSFGNTLDFYLELLRNLVFVGNDNSFVSISTLLSNVTLYMEGYNLDMDEDEKTFTVVYPSASIKYFLTDESFSYLLKLSNYSYDELCREFNFYC